MSHEIWYRYMYMEFPQAFLPLLHLSPNSSCRLDVYYVTCTVGCG